jgi:hypothetical protein
MLKRSIRRKRNRRLREKLCVRKRLLKRLLQGRRKLKRPTILLKKWL